MKTKIFLLWAIVAFAFTVTSCKDDTVKPEPPLQDGNHSIVETWIFTCEINPISIILDIDLENRVYVSTNPKIYSFLVDKEYPNYYYHYHFDDGEQFIIEGNKMYFYSIGDYFHKKWGFDIIKLSNDTMKLRRFGLVCTANHVDIDDYLLIKK